MRTGLLCLLLCLACGGCVTSVGGCEGPLQSINPPQSKPAPSSLEPDSLVP
jgi:hypothetical protein